MFKSLFKKVVIVCAAAAMMTTAVCADGSSSSVDWEKNFSNIGRGLVNVVTCWMEVPRCLVYHNSQVPVLGLVVGACQGAGFTAIRAFAGVADILSFGFMSDSIYTSCHGFDEWVWDERWVPHE
ncbi:MAG: hypothetical protein IKD10_08425 [Lentisphaeria bacterium]|nr:hypothetical protein [Lentisphaerota bacterium]MBR7144953.1 hypothetical protein [Lentisphaeria bacterium]